jgi:hypothetical protein
MGDVITGFQRTGSVSYDGSRNARAAWDRWTADSISFRDSAKELLMFAWEVEPQTFERVQRDKDGRLAYVAGVGYQFRCSQLVQRQFTSDASGDIAKGFIDEDPGLLDEPWFPYMVYSGAVGATASGDGSGVYYGPFSGSGEWIIDGSEYASDPETGEVKGMTVLLRAVSQVQYGSSLESYSFPALEDIAEMRWMVSGSGV